jgi:hypothetical protein
LAFAGTLAVDFGCRRLGAVLTAWLTPLLQRALNAAACFLLVLLVIGPHVMRDGWRNFGLLERNVARRSQTSWFTRRRFDM